MPNIRIGSLGGLVSFAAWSSSFDFTSGAGLESESSGSEDGLASGED
jgi:hypothetical protein